MLATAILYLSGTTLFELTGTFWKAFLGWCAAISCLLLVLACTNAAPAARRVLRPAIDFLAGEPGDGSRARTPQRRGSVIYYFLVGFLWWNFVLAPGLYGNDTALRMFDSVYCDYLGDADCRPENVRSKPSIRPVTPFVISATSLDKEAERYFVLHPEAYREGCDSERTLREIPEFYRVFRTDPRWHEFGCHPLAGAVIEKVFASGSPFPVFPATKVVLDDTGEEEWLVDGGFAHNIPMEAASTLGATSIIVLSSSPLTVKEPAAGELSVRWYGNLIANINRLFPYLFERSQVEDAIRARDTVVVAMAPTYRGDDWPALTDFRGVTVERMIDEAERDLDQRLAVVESWGRPVCEISGTVWRCDDVR